VTCRTSSPRFALQKISNTREFDMTDVQPEDTEFSAQEFEVDPLAQDVEVSDVQTTGNADVASQDPEAQEVGR
jgi:hypothetical protein